MSALLCGLLAIDLTMLLQNITSKPIMQTSPLSLIYFAEPCIFVTIKKLFHKIDFLRFLICYRVGFKLSFGI